MAGVGIVYGGPFDWISNRKFLLSGAVLRTFE